MIRLCATLLCLLANPLSAQCRQALALGMDVSGSVDSREYRLQLSGLAAALRHPEVVQLILSNPSTFVRIAIYEWSEPGHQRLLLGWTDVRSTALSDRHIATRFTEMLGWFEWALQNSM